MHQFTDVTVYSNDEKLIKAVSNEGFSVTSSDQNIVEYNVAKTIKHTGPVSDSDLIIYDIGFVDNQESDDSKDLQLSKDLQHLKHQFQHKPIVLIGEKESVRKVAKHKNISPLISRTITKPALRGHVDIIIRHVLSTERKNSEAKSTKAKPSKALNYFFYATLATFAIIVISGYLYSVGF